MKSSVSTARLLFLVLAMGLLACLGIGLYLLNTPPPDAMRTGLLVLLPLQGLLVLLALWSAWRAWGATGDQQSALIEVLQQMKDGDLTASVPSPVQGEPLAAALEDTLKGQRELVRGVRQPFEALATELYRLVKQNRAQLTASSQLARQLQDSVAVQGEGRRHLETLFDSAQRAGEASDGHQQSVRRGHALIRDMSRAAGELRQSLQETSKTAKRQGELIQSVTGAAEYIQGLNTRVAVVAINTRIEAERAGEQGRPLLGIAEALGELLRDAEGEGRRISGEIRLLQNLSAENLGSLETTVSAVVTILEFVDRLDSVLEQTTQSAAQLQTLVGQVKESAGTSSRGLRQLESGNGELLERSGEIADQGEQLRQGIVTLQQALSNLGRGLSHLRVDRAEPAALASADNTGAAA